MRKILAVIGLTLLVGCAPPPLDVHVICIPLRTWTQDEQAQLAAALSAAPQTSPIWTLAKDWEQMRDADRACLKSPTP
jgi:hypothetical protein